MQDCEKQRESLRFQSNPRPPGKRALYRVFFFFNDTATTEIYTLSLHDALPISVVAGGCERNRAVYSNSRWADKTDRKSTRLNSSHPSISYAVFCLKKKKKK